MNKNRGRKRFNRYLWLIVTFLMIPQWGGISLKGEDLAEKIKKTVFQIGVESDPLGAQVKLNGQVVGTTPWVSERLSTGTYQLEVYYPGYHPSIKSVQIPCEVGNIIRISLDPLPGSCWIRTDPPGAAVSRFSQYLGMTPLLIPPGILPKGKHMLKINKIGFESVDMEIDLVSDKVITLDLTLVPIVGDLEVIITPAGANLWIDGVNFGTAIPVSSKNRRGQPILIRGLLAGPHTVQLYYGDQPSIPQQIEIVVNKALSLDLRFWYPNFWVEFLNGEKLPLMSVEKKDNNSWLFLNKDLQFVQVEEKEIKRMIPIQDNEAIELVQRERIKKKMMMPPF